MKTNMLLLLLLSIYISVKADDTYSRTLVDGRRWNFMEIFLKDDTYKDTVYYTMEIVGEVEFDGKPCFQIKGNKADAYIPYLYENNGKVFTYQWDKAIESMVWKEVLNYGIDKSVQCVKSVDKIKVNGRYCRRIILDDGRYDDAVWVEGIGSNHDGPFIGNSSVIGTFLERSLLSVYDGENCIFLHDDFYKTGEAKINELLFIDYKSQTCDLYGRHLTAQPKSGVYIRDGKKYVVKE